MLDGRRVGIEGEERPVGGCPFQDREAVSPPVDGAVDKARAGAGPEELQARFEENR